MSVNPDQILQQPTASTPAPDLNGIVIGAATTAATQVAQSLTSGLEARITALETAAAPVVTATVTDLVHNVGQADTAVLGAVAHDAWLQRALALAVVGLAGVIVLVILVSALLGNGTAAKYVNDALAGAGVLLALVARVEGITLPAAKSTTADS